MVRDELRKVVSHLILRVLESSLKICTLSICIRQSLKDFK